MKNKLLNEAIKAFRNRVKEDGDKRCILIWEHGGYRLCSNLTDEEID